MIIVVSIFLALTLILYFIFLIIKGEIKITNNNQSSSYNDSPEMLAAVLPQATIAKPITNTTSTKKKKEIKMPASNNILDNSFINILKKIIQERTVSILKDYAKCKSLLQDYTAGEYKKESRLLLLAIEAGCPEEIEISSEPEVTKIKLINKLQDEYSLDKNAAEKNVYLLYDIYNDNRGSL